jgi:crossover junction endodeoxyribonuclease RuvC
MFRAGGIDPGLSGACAVYTPKGNPRLVVFDMPTVGEGRGRWINAAALRDWLVANRPSRLAIERANAMPSIRLTNGLRINKPPSAAFHYGDAFGSVRTCVVCCDIQYDLVVPQVWKRMFGLSGSDKEQSRQKALTLLPDCADLFTRKKDEARAEAALIALWEAEQ